MNEEIVNNLQAATDDLVQLLDTFDESQFQEVPYKDSWTPAQLADHVLKSVDGLAKTLTGTTGAPDRQPDEKLQALKDIFLNFDHKLQSPPFLIPSEQPGTREVLAGKISENINEALKVSPTLDLTQVCLDFRMPQMGHLTRLELFSFVTYHIKRHTHQLYKMQRAFADQSNS